MQDLNDFHKFYNDLPHFCHEDDGLICIKCYELEAINVFVQEFNKWIKLGKPDLNHYKITF